MNAEEAYKQTILANNELYLKQFEVKEVLNIIQSATQNGRFWCRYYYNELLKQKLISLGYSVSDMWKEDKWYETEYMTISWNFNKV